jgi:hypothetical protein
MVVHAVATLAVAEGAVVFRDEALLDSCRRGAAFLQDARNPELAWRYAPRGGENDTHCTSWVVAALVAAEQAGAPVDRACFDGARAWLDRMSSDGRVGYNFPGGLGARQEEMVESHPPDLVEPMTAAGLWAFTLMGGCDEASALTDTILACPPRWSSPKGTIDLCYWFFGAQALHAVQAKGAGGWLDKLTDALVPMQAKNGSWDPVGAWGLDGGRVYSTAMGALALLATVRTDPDALGGRRPDKQVRDALGLLLAAESDPDPRVAHAAWTALNAIPGARK